MSDNSKEAADQFSSQDTSGGNVVGKAPDKNKLYQPPAIFGKSGQGDNQSTFRGKGTN